MSEGIITFSVWVLPVLIAITFHEAAHGYVAWRLGDDTAKRLGRVTFNPLKHIDTYGTILVPALLLWAQSPFLFGWAKPVPVNFLRLGNPRRDMLLAVFNMLPLPPLDGGRVAVGLLPPALGAPLARLERFGLFIIIGALFILPVLGRELGVNLDIFHWLVGVPFEYLFSIVAALAGHG